MCVCADLEGLYVCMRDDVVRVFLVVCVKRHCVCVCVCVRVLDVCARRCMRVGVVSIRWRGKKREGDNYKFQVYMIHML